MTGMTFGRAVFVIGVVILVIDFLGKGKLFPQIPIGIVKFAIEIAALLAGIIMGASFGIGTVLVIALQASFFQFACRVCRFEPRDTVIEDVRDTVQRIMQAKPENSGVK